MYDEHLRRRAFLGVAVGGRATDVLGRMQRAAFGAARHENRQLHSVPKRAFSIPMFDLGEPYIEALEAVQLVVEQVAEQYGPFEVQLGQIEVWPNPSEPLLLSARVIDDGDKLTQLRADIAPRLQRYGFPVQDNLYVPSVPLIRVHGEGPPVEIENQDWSGVIKVNGLTGFVEQDRYGKFAVRSAWQLPLGVQQDALRQDEADAHDQRLRAQLDARLSQRQVNFRSRRVKTRVDSLMADGHGDGQQTVDQPQADENT